MLNRSETRTLRRRATRSAARCTPGVRIVRLSFQADTPLRVPFPLAWGEGSERAASVPIPKFAHPCGSLECELRNQRDTSQLYDSSAAFEPEVRKRTCGIMCANFGFAALAKDPGSVNRAQKQERPVDAKTAERPIRNHAAGAVVAEGKTKKIHQIAGSSDLVILASKDDITAGAVAKHDVIPGKAKLANATTCNVFSLLKACRLPVAFEAQDSATSFVAPKCSMLPYEVVIRREAHGSYLKRNPHLSRGQLFPRLIVEFFLKTKDKNWKGKPLVCDDPLLIYSKESSQVRLFNPAKPIQGQEPFLTLPQSDVFSRDEEWRFFPEMQRIARQAFLVLEKAWQLQAGTLVDLKVEFGFDTQGRLLLADVIDNDSWRVLEDGSYI